MMCEKIRPVNIEAALAALPGATFVDTGGTNGWLASPMPDWVARFVKDLGLPGVPVKVDLRKLPPGQGIPPHVDPKRHCSPKVTERRFHVPLLTHPGVTMRWPQEGEEVHLEAGWLYEVRFDREHEVVNRAPVDRVHLVIHTAEASDVAA